MGTCLRTTGSYHSRPYRESWPTIARSLTAAAWAQLVVNLVALIPAICNRIFHVLFRSGAYPYLAIGIGDKKTVSQVKCVCHVALWCSYQVSL